MNLQQIKFHLNLFSQQIHDSEGAEKLRNFLKKHLLTEIMKSVGEDQEFYKICLAETNNALNIDNKEAGYHCMLVGCKFLAKRHQNYVQHLKKCHPSLKNVCCNFRKSCRRNFESIGSLIIHLKQVHSRRVRSDPEVTPVAVIDVPCKCDKISCGGFKFHRIKELMRHYNSFHANEPRQCIFADCKVVFHAAGPTSAMHHFRRHKQTMKLDLKPCFLQAQTPQISLSQNAPDTNLGLDIIGNHDSEDYSEADIEALENLDIDDNVGEADDDILLNEDYYLLYYAHFLNKIAHFKHVPQQTIQYIVEENISNTKRTLERQEKSLIKSLEDKGIAQSDIEKIVNEVLGHDPFLEAQLQLNTEYKRTKFI